MNRRCARSGVVAAAARNDGVAALDEEGRHEQRLQYQRNRAGIRGWIRLTGPGAEAGMGDRSAMMVSGRFRIDMIDYAGDGKDGQDQVEPCQHCRRSGNRCPHPHHGITLWTARTTVGASQSRGPTARPINVPCGSMKIVVGSARTR